MSDFYGPFAIAIEALFAAESCLKAGDAAGAGYMLAEYSAARSSLSREPFAGCDKRAAKLAAELGS